MRTILADPAATVVAGTETRSGETGHCRPVRGTCADESPGTRSTLSSAEPCADIDVRATWDAEEARLWPYLTRPPSRPAGKFPSVSLSIKVA